MSSLPNPEVLTGLDETITDQGPGIVVEFQDYVRGKDSTAALGDLAIGDTPIVAIAETDTLPIIYYDDWRRVKDAQMNPRLFDDLIKEYRGFIRLRASAYFISGGDNNDLTQEGLYGFIKAVRDYNGRDASFRSFAELCITRQIITAIKTANRYKHRPLNNAFSFSHTPAGYDNGSDFTLEDIIPSTELDVPDIVIGNMELEELLDFLGSKLSPLEEDVVKALLNDLTYEEAALELGVNCKAIDNAIQRIKRKVWAHRGYENRRAPYAAAKPTYNARTPAHAPTPADTTSAYNPPPTDVLPPKDLEASLDEQQLTDSLPEVIDSDLEPISYEAASPEPTEDLKLPSTVLTPLEDSVLRLRSEGKPNNAITEELGVSIKSVNDAIQRARRKTHKDREGESDWLAFINSPHRRNTNPEPIPGLDMSPAAFTPLEYQVLKLRREGMSNKAITEELGVNRTSINSALTRAKRKVLKERVGELVWAAFTNSPYQRNTDPEPIPGLDMSPAAFTPLEYQVLKLQYKGLTYRAISEELGIKVYTVCNTLKRARHKISERAGIVEVS